MPRFFRGCCCKCFISSILNNQVVTSIGCVLLRRKTDVIVVRGSMTVSERDYLSFVSGSGLWEPVLLMLHVILGWSLRGLSGLRKKVSVRSRSLTSVRNNLIRVIFRVYTNLFFRDTSIVTQHLWALFCHYWFYAPPHIPSYCRFFVRIFLYPLPNLAVNLYVARVCLINHFIVVFCNSPFYYM